MYTGSHSSKGLRQHAQSARSLTRGRWYVVNMFTDIQTSKELIQMDISKMNGEKTLIELESNVTDSSSEKYNISLDQKLQCLEFE